MLAAAQPEWNMTIYTAEQAGHFGRRRYLMENAMTVSYTHLYGSCSAPFFKYVALQQGRFPALREQDE